MSIVNISPRRLIAAVSAVSLLLLAACSDDEEPRISTADAIAEPASAGDDTTIEMIIYSSTGDAITGVEVSENVAESTALVGPDDDLVPDIQLPRDELFPLSPGTGYIRLVNLTRDLAVGDRFDITLVMADGDDAFIPIEVSDE